MTTLTASQKMALDTFVFESATKVSKVNKSETCKESAKYNDGR
jgi:hypothetical protein